MIANILKRYHIKVSVYLGLIIYMIVREKCIKSVKSGKVRKDYYCILFLNTGHVFTLCNVLFVFF